jgi:hypothetical protein
MLLCLCTCPINVWWFAVALLIFGKTTLKSHPLWIIKFINYARNICYTTTLGQACVRGENSLFTLMELSIQCWDHHRLLGWWSFRGRDKRWVILCGWNHKALLRENEEDLNKWKCKWPRLTRALLKKEKDGTDFSTSY